MGVERDGAFQVIDGSCLDDAGVIDLGTKEIIGCLRSEDDLAPVGVDGLFILNESV